MISHQPRDIASILRRGVERVRKEGFWRTFVHYLGFAGLRVVRFHYMKETLPKEIPAALKQVPDGFEFSLFDPADVVVIDQLPERRGYVPQGYVLDCLKRGNACLGIKSKGEIVAFTWFSVEECRSIYHHARMKSNEAYLFDMYVLKAFRGDNLAPILRYLVYEFLGEMGRDTFYSITEVSNTASFRFKEKLGAEVVFLGLYVSLFGRWHLRRILSYPA